jgi:cardiolipin synthase
VSETAPSVCHRTLGPPGSYVGIGRCATARPTVYWGRAERRRQQAGHRGRGLTFPNLITLGRILSVPVVVWAIAAGEMRIAFLLFLLAGISDAVDGYLAKRFDMTSELGRYLDPLADKVLIVSIYVALGIAEAIPRWLVILVVSRDIMIIGAVMLSWLVGQPIEVKPLLVSKLNTVAQILFAGLVLASLGFQFEAEAAKLVAMAAVAGLTLLSVAFYVAEWVRHMNAKVGE